METAAHQEHPCGKDVQVIELIAGDHSDGEQAGQLSQRQHAGQPGQEQLLPVRAGRCVDRVVHGGQDQLGSGVESHHHGPDIALGCVGPDGSWITKYR